MELVAILGVIVIIAFCLLTLFDRVAGRGPKQVADGIGMATNNEKRIPCPMCAERILPQAKICPFCKSEVRKSDNGR
jgi:hypothetical protein